MRKLKNGQGYIVTETKSFKQIRREAFETYAKVYDDRDKVFGLMKEVEDKTGIINIPEKYKNDARVMMNYDAYKILGSWRKQPRFVMQVRRAALKTAKKQTKKNR